MKIHTKIGVALVAATSLVATFTGIATAGAA